MKKLLILLLAIGITTPAWAGNHHLDIRREVVNITGTPVEKITVNGGIPGPTLHFTEGEEAVITVTNHLDEDTSVHWHGLLLPGEMDGVPGFNGFPGIRPQETFTYRFPLRQAGTYWYHAHSMGQEQDGHYGSIVIHPKGTEPNPAERDYVVLISDFHEQDADEIMANLKMSAEYYQYARPTVGDFFDNLEEKGWSGAWKAIKPWGEMRMLPSDLTDVTGYTFLTNGKTPQQNWTGLFTAGERVRLRFINASAMSFFDVRIPGLKMTVVAADGQDIEPVEVDEFRFGAAETYDVIVTPPEEKAYTIAAESIDRTGFALGTLAPRQDMRGEIPPHRPRTTLTMADMGMAGMDHSQHGGGSDAEDTHAAMGHDMADMEDMHEASGWADAATPADHKALDYRDLRYAGIQKDQRPADRDITIRLGGNMERYIWTMNGKKFSESGPMRLRYGERVRITFINDTMMAHPMHLHGMFVQLENGQSAAKQPNKHTVVIEPGTRYSVMLTADEPGEWAFHCHLLYHMLSGMMTKLTVEKVSDIPTTPAHQPMPADASHDMKKMEGHHAH